jgi:preprotein translocase subunit SecD
MRRIITYIVLSITSFLLVGINFLSVIGGINTNLEFTSGREMVFRISEKENEDFVFENDNDVTDIAKTMIQRLENSLVTKYEVNVEGNDQIRVTVSETSETKYKRIQDYLRFDAEFSLCTTTDDCADNDQLFEGQTARVVYKGQNPFVVFPVNDLESLEKIVTEAGGAESTDGEILLWAGKLEADSYSDSLNNPDMAEKILLRFPVANMWWDQDKKTELAFLVSPSKFGSANENNIFAATVVAQANEEAIFYRNLVNAGDLPYSVEFLYSQNVSAAIEPLLSLENILTIANSQTLRALLASTLMMMIVLVIVYRLGSIGMLATTTLSVFLTLFSFIWLNLEFSSAALLGILSIGVLGLLTSVLYLTYVRREIYQGRPFKKSHIEANGKLIPLMLDITVTTLIFGLFVYIYGGNIAQNFAVMLMLGSLINLVVVYLGNQLLYGQLMQTTNLIQYSSWLNLEAKFIPNLLKDEKPVYSGRFSTRDFTSRGKFLSPIALFGGLLSLAAVLVLTTFNMPVIQAPVSTNPSRLYLEVKEEFSLFETTADVNDMIADIRVDGEALTLSDLNIQIHEFTRRENDIDVLYRIFVAELDLDATDTTTFAFDNGQDPVIIFTNFNELLEFINTDTEYEDDQVTVIGFYPTTLITNQPTILDMTIGMLISLVIVGVYLSIRQGLATGITSILISGSIGLFTLGLFIASRIASPDTLALSLLSLTYLSLLLIMVIFARAKEDLALIKDRSITIDDLTLALKKASSQSAAIIFLIGLAMVYPGLTFLTIGPGALQGLFAAILLGSALASLFVTAVIPATFKPFHRLFKGVNAWLSFDWMPAKTKAGKPSTSERSNEPQEATYIGIND